MQERTVRTVLAAVLACVFGVSAFAGEMREWTSASGERMTAAFVERQGDLVILRGQDGGMVRIPINRLSAADQVQVGSQGQVAASPTAPAAPGGSHASVAAMGELFGEELMNASRRRVPVSELAGKRVGIYFSASWCPPCRAFTPRLVEAYRSWQDEGLPVEVVLVSGDRSAADMFQYMRTARMPWLAVPYGSEVANRLRERFSVRGIPMLVVVDAEGNTVTTNGRGAVAEQGAAAIQRW